MYTLLSLLVHEGDASFAACFGVCSVRKDLYVQFTADMLVLDNSLCQGFFFFFFWVTGELSTLSQMMEVPNKPGLSPNNGLFVSGFCIAAC